MKSLGRSALAAFVLLIAAAACNNDALPPASGFTTDKVPSGIVDYTVQATGYTVLSSTTNVEPGKPFELDLTLAAPTGH